MSAEYKAEQRREVETSSPREMLDLYPEMLTDISSHQLALMVVINAQSGKIWVHEEQENKPETGKKIGDKNVISETAKFGETPLQTLSYGIVDEFIGSDSLRHTDAAGSLHLAWLSEPPFYRYDALHANVVLGVFVYDGTDEAIMPEATHEVGNGAWMDPDAFLQDQKIRKPAAEIVGWMREEGALEDAVDTYNRREHLTFDELFPIAFPQGDIVSEYHARQRKSDVTSAGISAYRRLS